MIQNHRITSGFLHYLFTQAEGDGTIPSLTQLSEELGISVASLREQLEVAKALGLVEIRPRTGIRRLPYSFFPAVRQSLFCGMELDRSNFNRFADLRIHIEEAYWEEAVRNLTGEDLEHLRDLLASAWDKLHGKPVQIPHAEHRELHLSIYRRLENPFVLGLLEAYWDAYESVGLNLYADYHYLEQVWTYHQTMVDSIAARDYSAGFQALVEHQHLLNLHS
jgi:DNA-binding FadR family transcriptional regulator